MTAVGPSMSDQGFTLIELLIVIVVLGVLAGIAVLAFDPFESASDQVCNEASTAIAGAATAADEAGIGTEALAGVTVDCP